LKLDVTAFVTGASRGLGRVIARRLAADGANVALAARSDGIHETADLIGSPDRTLPISTDVTDPDTVADAVTETVETFGGLDCVVNNAGVPGPVLPFDRIDHDAFLDVQAVNVVGPHNCVRAAAPHLRASDRGSVINIGSIGGKRPYPNRTPYAASKMALIGLSRTLAFELGRDDVTVNTILPGPIQGPRIEAVLEKQQELADVENAEPLTIAENDFALPDYLTDPADVAEQVAYLAGPHARHITGQEIAVDAGGTWY